MKERSLILLREAQGLSYAELANVFSCSEDSIKGSLKRARRKLVRYRKEFNNN